MSRARDGVDQARAFELDQRRRGRVGRERRGGGEVAALMWRVSRDRQNRA